MVLRPILIVVVLAACSQTSFEPSWNCTPSFSGGSPPATCASAVPLRGVSSPTAVVGDGTPGSCTAEKLQTAADGGGTIVFSCGSSPTTITVSSPIIFKKETVLDGGGLITLSGGGRSRILYLDSAYNVTTPRLTVQRLTFRDGSSPRSGDDTANGGGAIYRDGGSLTVIDCVFLANRAPLWGQDVAGGAIYGFGGGDIIISGSTFECNAASDGGAVGSLNGDLTIVNSSFTRNGATGWGGNPGHGGCGGAVYMDGADEQTNLCGVTIANNQAGAIGGGFFRVSNYSNGTFTMDRTTVDSNRVTATGTGDAGGLYLQGLKLTVTNSAISRNQAYYSGGIWIHNGNAQTTNQVQMTNVTVAENVAGSNGAGIWLSNNPTGTLLNCTIANNQTTVADQVAGGIFSSGLTLQNTIVSDNTANWQPNCDKVHDDGGGNLQWPNRGTLCTSNPLIADPLLGSLGDHGGTTETLVPDSTSPAKALGTGCPATDQRGQSRSTSSCTSGAVEVP